MKVEFYIQDNSQAFKNASDKALDDALFAIGLQAQKNIVDYMTQQKIVQTGRLRGSISFITPLRIGVGKPVANSRAGDQIQGNSPKGSVIVGSNVEYAKIVNDGTGRRKPRRFMQIGINKAMPQFKEITENIFKGGKV